MWPALGAIVLFAACCGGPSSPAPPTGTEREPSAGSPLRLRFVSYNVNFGVAGDENGVHAVSALEPDLLVLQETNEAWETAFVAGLAARLPHHRFLPPPDRRAGGMAVMAKWPIASMEALPSPPGEGFFPALRIVVDSPAGKLQILNVHLRPPMSDGGSWVVGYFSTRGNREREAAVHAEALDRSLPTIVAGDFNEESDGAAVAIFLRKGYGDVLAQHAPGQRTWEWPVGEITLKLALDHILHDSRWLAAAGGISYAGRSDHYPIWADLELAPSD
jgi:endonuclease/exonuclease/phosphatase family metal-dependent hydrolase